MNTKLIKEKDAKVLLGNSEFIETWKKLCDNCPWINSFQLPINICLWYDNYLNYYQPIILIHHDDNDNVIKGLLFLAINIDKNNIIQAGDVQMEYQGWISIEKVLMNFFWDTNEILLTNFPKFSINIKYLYNSFPIEIIKDAIKKNKMRRVSIDRFDKPVIDLKKLDKEKLFLRKSSKSKYNRLSRIGNLEFKEIKDNEEFVYWLDQIINFYDFRQKAINNSTPFYSDKIKNEYFINLFDKGLLHVTIMCIENELISAFIGYINDREISNLIPTHSPFYAKHSPGLIHIKLLTYLMVNEGYEILDLTPGDGEKWKFNHTNVVETVYGITFNLSKKKIVSNKIKGWVRNSFPKIGQLKLRYNLIKEKRVVDFENKASNQRVIVANKLIKNKLSFLRNIQESNDYKKNNLKDLLLAMNNDELRNDFFYNTLKNIENGNDIYSKVHNRKLINYLF